MFKNTKYRQGSIMSLKWSTHYFMLLNVCPGFGYFMLLFFDLNASSLVPGCVLLLIKFVCLYFVSMFGDPVVPWIGI